MTQDGTSPGPRGAPGLASGASLAVAVLVAHWEQGTEEGWAARQVAGALACCADVHVVTPDGPRPTTSRDGVFTLHRMGHPIDPRAELRRDLLLDALSAGADRASNPGRPAPVGQPAVPSVDLGPLLDGDLVQPWRGATAILADLRPDLVLVVGHRNLGALAALDAVGQHLPCALLVLASDLAGIGSAHFHPLFDRAGTVLTVTQTEAAAVEACYPGAAVHHVGLPGGANPSVLREPNSWVGDTGYVLVLTNGPGEPVEPLDEDESELDRWVRETQPEASLARLLRLRFPHVPVGVSSTGEFVAWHHGRRNAAWPIARSSDLERLVAWAAVTVDLRPGPLVARRCIDSLLFGTPIVVPAASRAREHAELGRGGLWFSDPGELVWCVDALLDPAVGPVFGAQGRQYAEEHYGSTDGFIHRVLVAVGLDAGTPSTSESQDLPASA